MISLFSPRMKNNELWSWRLISSSFSSDHLRFRCYMKQMTVEQLDWDWTWTSYFFHCTVLYLSRTDSMFNVSEPSAERERAGVVSINLNAWEKKRPVASRARHLIFTTPYITAVAGAEDALLSVLYVKQTAGLGSRLGPARRLRIGI